MRTLPFSSSVNGKTTCVNVYDIRLSDEYPACGMNWPPDLTSITPYLRRDDVRVALHVPAAAEAWTECRGNVGRAMTSKKSRPSVELLPKILEKGVEVLLFSGDQDLICNYVGTENMIKAMEWDGAVGFNVRPNCASRCPLTATFARLNGFDVCCQSSIKADKWTVNGTAAGEWTSQRNLTYVKVRIHKS